MIYYSMLGNWPSVMSERAQTRQPGRGDSSYTPILANCWLHPFFFSASSLPGQQEAGEYQVDKAVTKLEAELKKSVSEQNVMRR